LVSSSGVAGEVLWIMGESWSFLFLSRVRVVMVVRASCGHVSREGGVFGSTEKGGGMGWRRVDEPRD